MPILAKQALAHVKHELGKNLPSEIDPMLVLNMAGRHLVSMRAWSWLNRGSAALNVNAGVSYVVLPDDYGHPRYLLAADSLLTSVRVVSSEELAFRRATQESPGEGIVRWAAFVHVASDYPNGGPPTQRIDLYNTPQTTTVGALILVYRAGWTEIASDAETLALHPSCDLLYIETLRAVCQGLMKSHEATITQRLSIIEAGAVFRDAAADDINSMADTPAFDPGRYTVLWPVPKITNQ